MRCSDEVARTSSGVRVEPVQNIVEVLRKVNMTRIILPILCIICTLPGCATQPAEIREVKIPVPVVVNCETTVAKPETVQPQDNSRVEWLRAYMINHERLTAYVKELEATLEACK